MSEVTIRLARPDELRQVQDLNYELFLSDDRHFHDLNHKWPYEADGETYFRDRIAGTRGGVCFVAEQDGRLLGYLAGGLQKVQSAYTGKRAEIETICVSESARNHGVGHRLTEAFLDWCRQRRVEHVMVNAYAPNRRAVDFYQQNGFTPYSTTLWRDLPLDKDESLSA